MSRVVIVVAPGAGFGPGAVAWNDDVEGAAAGTAVVEPAKGEVFFPGLVEVGGRPGGGERGLQCRL